LVLEVFESVIVYIHQKLCFKKLKTTRQVFSQMYPTFNMTPISIRLVFVVIYIISSELLLIIIKHLALVKIFLMVLNVFWYLSNYFRKALLNSFLTSLSDITVYFARWDINMARYFTSMRKSYTSVIDLRIG